MSVPSTAIKMGVYPRPQGGNHVVTYASQTARQASVDSYMTVSRTGQQFVRPTSGTFRIDAPYNLVENCNYGYFQNGTGRVYYFDILSCEYDNDMVTIVHFDIDVLATYYTDYARTSQRVLREHVNDDAVGANIQPEPVGTGDLTYTWFRRTASQPAMTLGSNYDFDLRESAVFVFAGDQADGNKVYSGVLDGTIEGACCWVIPVPIQEDGSYFTSTLTDWLWSMNRSNNAESIVAMTMYPLDMLPSTIDRYQATPVFGDSGDRFNTNNITFKAIGDDEVNDLNGYTPRNNKLYTYPYCFMRVSNNKGQYHDYRYEFFGAAPETGKYTFVLKGSADPAGDIWCMPAQYNNGVSGQTDEAISLGGIPQISWTFNSYQNWLAGNAGSLAMNLLSTAAMFIPGVGIGVKVAGAAGKALAVGNTTRSFLRAAGTGASMARGVAADAARASMRQSWAEIPGLAKGAAALAAGQGLSSAGNLAATLYDQSNVPDAVRGQATNPSTMAVGAYGFTFMGMGVRPEFAKCIDDFFTVYGYACNENKVPNETGRKNYNFVQTQGASFHSQASPGGVPAAAMASINAMYDEGIWFWHDPATAGDFTDDNPIA